MMCRHGQAGQQIQKRQNVAAAEVTSSVKNMASSTTDCHLNNSHDQRAKHELLHHQRGLCTPCLWGLFPIFLVVELLLKYTAWSLRYEILLLELPGIDVRLSWTYSENNASALGFLSSVPLGLRQWIWSLLLVLLLAAAIWACLPGKGRLTRAGVFCLVVGGLGNFIDRMLLSFVVDYLAVHLPDNSLKVNFNASDLLLNVGTFILLYKLWTTN